MLALTVLTGLFVVAPTGDRHVAQADGPRPIVFRGATFGWNQETGTTKVRAERSTGRFAGQTCAVRGVIDNSGSVHRDNDVIVESGGSVVVLEDVEGPGAPRTFTPGSIEFGATVRVSTFVGNVDYSEKWGDFDPPRGFFSAKVTISFECWTTPTSTEPPVSVSLVKVVEGGSASPVEWVVSASGSRGEIAGAGEASGLLPPGTYSLSESEGPPGYAPGEWSCVGGSLSGSELTIGESDAPGGVECSITNTWADPPLVAVRLVKEVEGSASPDEWVVRASGSGGEIAGAGEASGLLPLGTYVLSESGGPSGYRSLGWECDGGTLTGSTLTIGAADVGDGVDCSNTSVFEPPPPAEVKVSLEKVVEPGGSASADQWEVRASQQGEDVISGRGKASGLLPFGTYVLSDVVVDERNDALKYSVGEWVCGGRSLRDGVLTIGPDDVAEGVVCRNASAPPIVPPVTVSVSLEKVVEPGGSASATEWVVRASGSGGEISGAGEASGLLPLGTYVLSESGGPSGYRSLGWECDGGTLTGSTLTIGAADVGDGVDCSNTSVVEPPPPAEVEVSLEKVVVGGSASRTEWEVRASGSGGEISGDGVASGELPPGTYSLSTSGGPPGYPPGEWSCDGGTLTGSTLTIGAADVRDGVVCSNTSVLDPRPIEVDAHVVVRGDCQTMISYRVTATGVDEGDTVDIRLLDVDRSPLEPTFDGRPLTGMIPHPGAADGADPKLRAGGFLVAEVRGVSSEPVVFGADRCDPPPQVEVRLHCDPVPRLTYLVREPAEGPVTITLTGTAGFTASYPDQELEGELLYPGAADQPNDWPGWRREPNGSWVADPSDRQLAAGGVLTVAGAGFSADAVYPPLPSPPACAPPPDPPSLELLAPPSFDLTAPEFDPEEPLPGTYALRPSGPPGYDLPVRCDNAEGAVTEVTLRAAEDVTCTLDPQDTPPSLVIEKRVEGGTAERDDFVVAVIGYDAESPVPGEYPLRHVEGPPDYDRAIRCDNADGEVASVTLSRGEIVTCTFLYVAVSPPPPTTTIPTTPPTTSPTTTIPTTTIPTTPSTTSPTTTDPPPPRGSLCTGVGIADVVCVVLDDLSEPGDCASELTYIAYLVNRTADEHRVRLRFSVSVFPRNMESPPAIVEEVLVPAFDSRASVQEVEFRIDVPSGARRLDAELSVTPVEAGADYAIEGAEETEDIDAEGFETTLRRCDG